MRKRPLSKCTSPSISSPSYVFHGQESRSPNLLPTLATSHIWPECESSSHNSAEESNSLKRTSDNDCRRILRQRRISEVFRCYDETYLSSPLLTTPAKFRKLIPKRHRRPSKIISICGLCFGSSDKNLSTNLPENLIACWNCGQAGHPTCLKMPPELVAHVRSLRWCCVECKRCCLCRSKSKASTRENVEPGSDLLLCDSCDRGFHMSCLDPPVSHLPEGNWICPICSPVNNEDPSAFVDPRLEAIHLNDQLSQSEIDWMHRTLNLNGQVYSSSPSPKLVHSTRVNTVDSHKVPISSPVHCPVSPTSIVSNASTNNLDRGSTLKISRRLVQKSLASWTIPKTRISPGKFRRPDATSAIENSPVAHRRRRTSEMANHAWQSLVRRRSSQASLKSEGNSGFEERGDDEDDDKTDILTNETENALPCPSSMPTPFSKRSRSRIRRRRRSRFNRAHSFSPLRLHVRDAKLYTLKDDVSSSSLRSVTLSSHRTRRRLSGLKRGRRIIRAHSRSMTPKHRGSLQRPWQRAWQLSRSHRLRPSISTLKRWSSLGVNIKQALEAFQKTGRVRLSSLSKVHSRAGEMNSISKYSKLNSSSLKHAPLNCDDAGDEDDDDNDSSVTVAAAELEVVGDAKFQGMLEHFDPNNDECPEFAVITDESRALFAEIQADVQACLPQPMESSLSLPPANNPKLLLSKESGDPKCQPGCLTGAIDAYKQDEQRYPPRIQLGRHIITTWYSAPYPSEYARLNLLYICEFCLKYSKTRKVYMRHIETCPFSFPPGNEIYRCGNVSVFEVDGYTSRLYCQQLCLLAKLFLDHKTLYYDVEPFLFYVVALREDNCFHLVGYFSKEKRSAQKFNLSCLMVLPPYQKLAYGRFLIDFSFLLSRIERQPGSPEKPLSELGRLSYESYWRSKVLPFILNSFKSDTDCDGTQSVPSDTESLNFHQCVFTIHQITACTGIDPHDVASTIEQLATSIQLGPDGRPLIYFDKTKLLQLKEKFDARKRAWIPVDEECLRWSPLIQPQEVDASVETCRTSSEIMSLDDNGDSGSHDASNHTTAPRGRVFPSMPSGVNGEPCLTNSTSNTVNRRSLRGVSTCKHETAKTDSTMDSLLTQPRRCSLRSYVSGSPRKGSQVLQTPTALPAYTTSTPTASDLYALAHLSGSQEKGEPRTIRCTRLTPPPTTLPQPNHSGTPQRRNRRLSKKPNPTSCRQNPFFLDDSEPPDPPPPNGGRCTSRTASYGACSSVHTHMPTSDRQNSVRSSHAENQCNDGTMAPNESITVNRQSCSDADPSPAFRVNSSLPGSDNLSPLRPAHSSSPRALLDQLLDQRLCTDVCSPAESPGLPPSLTPPPPTLSLLEGTDSVLAECVVPLSRTVVSPKDPVAPTAPPCLSFYDSICHLPSSDEHRQADASPPPSHSELYLLKCSSGSPGRNTPKVRQRHGDSLDSTSGLQRHHCLTVGTSQNSSATFKNLDVAYTRPGASPLFVAIPTSPQPRSLSPSPVHLPSSSPMCIYGESRIVNGVKSCPSSPLEIRSASSDLILYQCLRRSVSMSLLHKGLNDAELPSVTRHSPSHSPPLLPPPTLDALTNQIPVLIPSLSDAVGVSSCSNRWAARSPSPPLLTNVRSANLTDEETSGDVFTVRATAPLLFPSNPTRPSLDSLPRTSFVSVPTGFYPQYSSQFDPASDANDSDSSSDTLPMCLDEPSHGDTQSVTTLKLSSASLFPISSFPTSPVSYHSSEETVAMNLPSPDLQLSDDDAIHNLNHMSFDNVTEAAGHPLSRSSSAPDLSFSPISPIDSSACRSSRSCPPLVSSPFYLPAEDNSQCQLLEPQISPFDRHPPIVFDYSQPNDTFLFPDLQPQSTVGPTPGSFTDAPSTEVQPLVKFHSASEQQLPVLTPDFFTPLSDDVITIVASQSSVTTLPLCAAVWEEVFGWDVFTSYTPLSLCNAHCSLTPDFTIQQLSVLTAHVACAVQLRMRPATCDDSIPSRPSVLQQVFCPLEITTSMTTFGRQISSDPVALPSTPYNSCVGRTRRRRSESSFSGLAHCGPSLFTQQTLSTCLQPATSESLHLSQVSACCHLFSNSDGSHASVQRLSTHHPPPNPVNFVCPPSVARSSTQVRKSVQSRPLSALSFNPNICANELPLDSPNPFSSEHLRAPSNTPYFTSNTPSSTDRSICHNSDADCRMRLKFTSQPNVTEMFTFPSSLSSEIITQPYVSSSYSTLDRTANPYLTFTSRPSTILFQSPSVAQPRCSFRNSKKRPYPTQRNGRTSRQSDQTLSSNAYSPPPRFTYAPFFQSNVTLDSSSAVLQSSQPITFPPPTLLSEPQSGYLPTHVSAATTTSDSAQHTAPSAFFPPTFMSPDVSQAYMVSCNLSTPTTLSLASVSDMNNPCLTSFVDPGPFCASLPVATYPCPAPSQNFSSTEPLFDVIPSQHHSCGLDSFPPIMSMSPAYGNNGLFVEKKGQSNALCFSPSFQSSDLSVAHTNPLLCPPRASEVIRFMQAPGQNQETTDPSDKTVFDISPTSQVVPRVEPSQLNPVVVSPRSIGIGALCNTFPTADTRSGTALPFSAFTCPTSMYSQITNSASQQFVICPPLFIYPPEGTSLGEFLPLPTSPHSSFTPANESGYPAGPSPMAAYPLAAPSTFSWPHSDLLSGQTIPQSVLTHPMMPT
ncbi:unnamed protein product [Dicrocoelium dendriticum]|nr:unnamed protein product [Dicrocoelium dendriticum]